MDTSVVPAEVADMTNGSPFYVGLPKVGIGGETMDGILFGLPGIDDDSLKMTSLTGANVGSTANINGVEARVDEVLPDNMQAMRREIVVTSNEFANQLHFGDEKYEQSWGVIVPASDELMNDISVELRAEEIQSTLDDNYGEDAYTTITYEEFQEGIQKFMAGNGTALLMMVALGFVFAGAGSQIEMMRREMQNKTRQLSTLRAIGGSPNQALRPEMFKMAYRAGLGFPIGGAVAVGLTEAVNFVNPGLDGRVDIKNWLSAAALLTLPAAAVGIRTGLRISNDLNLVDGMKPQ